MNKIIAALTLALTLTLSACSGLGSSFYLFGTDGHIFGYSCSNFDVSFRDCFHGERCYSGLKADTSQHNENVRIYSKYTLGLKDKTFIFTSENEYGKETCYIRNGKLHNENGPALISERAKEWFFDGELHRQDGPAHEGANGERRWYLYGELHREGGPAIERPDGSKEWYQNGFRGRNDGPSIVTANGTKVWINGLNPYREDGPAIEFSDGRSVWCKNKYESINNEGEYSKLRANSFSCLESFTAPKNPNGVWLTFPDLNFNAERDLGWEPGERSRLIDRLRLPSSGYRYSLSESERKMIVGLTKSQVTECLQPLISLDSHGFSVSEKRDMCSSDRIKNLEKYEN